MNSEMERIHPHEVMARLVNDYEKTIKTAIAKKDTGYLRALGVELSIADEIIRENACSVKPQNVIGMFLRAQSSINSLAGIHSEGGLYEELSASLERDIATIDLLLAEDAHYKIFRREEK